MNFLYSGSVSDDAGWRYSWRDEVNGRAASIQEGSPKWDNSHLDINKLNALAKHISGIRSFGYLEADVNPLEKNKPGNYSRDVEDLGIESDLLDTTVAQLAPYINGLINEAEFTGTVYDFLNNLRVVYCGNIGYELSHVRNDEERNWLHNQIENRSFSKKLSKNHLLHTYQLLLRAEMLENFLHKAYPGQRWYSLEGLESSLVLVNRLIVEAISDKVDNITIGMAHRGRLNFLAHILGKPYEDIIDEFSDKNAQQLTKLEHSGWLRDVKYHQGADYARDWDHDGTSDIRLRMTPNPSHLELASPVVQGAVRAIQDAGEAGLALLLHGDAAFAGQGIVMEALNMANLDGYNVGGTIHIMLNNQIGFTTSPSDSFSGHCATDIARGFDIPVVHVNADNVQACITVAKLAAEYRRQFKKDIVIDLIGYRRYGHNESDDPSLTQPKMYEKIASHPTLLTNFAHDLIENSLLTKEEFDADKSQFLDHLFEVKNERKNTPPSSDTETIKPDLGRARWSLNSLGTVKSVVDADLLKKVNSEMTCLPDKFNPHPSIVKLVDKRSSSLEDNIDWGHAENLAFATLVTEGYNVRLTGQDSARGTFSQRHAVLYDYKTNKGYKPIDRLKARGRFDIHNSPLSEMGVLAFEYGYSTSALQSLVIWEAQFGDFVNTAQSVVDELIVSGAAKWGQQTSVALLLPHGYEGQGPNHSSAHLERFLSLAVAGNMRIIVPTTAAQYFHALRAHAANLQNRPVPIVIVTGKSLLRHAKASATLLDLSEKQFQPIRTIIPDNDPGKVRWVVMCSGKVFVDLLASPKLEQTKNVMFICIEELYPLPLDLIKAELQKLPKDAEINYAWLQEEPRNRGAFEYISGKRALIIGENKLNYIGRPATSSAAEGASWLHKIEQQALVEKALNPNF